MADEIIVSPNPLRIATGVEGQLEVGGSILYAGRPVGVEIGELITQNLSLDVIQPFASATKNGAGHAEALGTVRVPAQQPVWIAGYYDTVKPFLQTTFIGLKDNLGRNYQLQAFSNAFDSGAWHYLVVDQDIAIGGYTATPVGTGQAVYTDGRTIFWAKQLSGVWSLLRSLPIPADVTDLRYTFGFFNNAALGSTMRGIHRRIDDVIIPINTIVSQLNFPAPNPTFTSRIVDVQHFGITATAVGETIAEISVPNTITPVAPVNVTVQAEALYIKPKNGDCGDIVIEGQVVEFESNGGIGGIFEASNGTVLPDLKWQAPFAEASVLFTYTIGMVTATCALRVVPKLSVQGVDEDGNYPDLAQGDIVRFISTCEEAQWFSDPPNLVVRRGEQSGRFVAPTDATDDFFGAKDVKITVSGCGQQYSFNVHIQAMYPTPKFCGAIPAKWTLNEPDYLPNRLQMTGGTTQVKNRNAEGILTWEVEYSLLPENVKTFCTCDGSVEGVHQAGCTNDLATAERLSKFYRQVTTVKYFTLVDYHTDVLYRYVRLTQFQRSHTLFITEQARRVSMRQEGALLFDT